MRVIIQLRHSPQLQAIAAAASRRRAAAVNVAAVLAPPAETLVRGFVHDATFSAVQVPNPLPLHPGVSRFALAQPMAFSFTPEESTYLIRGEIPDEPAALTETLVEAQTNPNVVGVFADPAIESCPICPGDPAKGSDKDVAKLLGVAQLQKRKLNGSGVFLAIVDTGINLPHLVLHGHNSKIDTQNSWTPAGVTTSPGQHPVNHGTMCAYDAGITATKATFLDCAVLLSQASGPTAMSGLLSDAVKAYSHLLGVLNGMPAKSRRLVVSNSWGMFAPSWDFPVGHPGNYSNNPAHPFNIIVASLEAAGADILFAAGNCGRDCPDGRCQFGATPPICGANSHPKVISVAGIDVQKRRVGYSSQGPGRLSANKPDLAAYTHFKGSQVYPEDGGTSAACPVAAGIVAAFRTRYTAAQLSPQQLRSTLCKTAEDLGPVGFDFDHGWGALNPMAVLAALKK
jgi:subtilisin family serine protease